MKKLYTLIILIVVMTLSTSVTAFAASNNTKIKVTMNQKRVKYDVSPYVSDGEVMISVRQTAKALSGKVTWNKKSNTAWIKLDAMQLEFVVGKKEFYIHRDADFSGIPETVKLNNSIIKIGGRVFVPGKQVFKSMGMNISWDSKKRVLSITKETPLIKDVPYTIVSTEDIAQRKAVSAWYNENNQKQGIRYLRDGKYIYALVGAGERPTGGFTISIDEIYYSTYDTVTINASVAPPGDNVRVMMMITYPATLIRINSNTIKSIVGEVIDKRTSINEIWLTMDLYTVTKMELFNLDGAKLKDITGNEKDNIMMAFNEATIDPSNYIAMITGNILKVTTSDGYPITFTSYGSEKNVIATYEKNGATSTYHLVAPVIAKTLLQK